MIPTVPLELLFGLLMGLLFAGSARRQLRRGASPWGRELVAVLSFEGIVIWPVVLYYGLVHPAFSLMFALDPATLPPGSLLLRLVANLGVLVGGYFAGWALLRARRLRVLGGSLLAVGLLFVGAALLLSERLGHGGSYLAYQKGLAPRLWDTKLGWALGLTSVGVCVAALFVCLALAEEGRREHD